MNGDVMQNRRIGDHKHSAGSRSGTAKLEIGRVSAVVLKEELFPLKSDRVKRELSRIAKSKLDQHLAENPLNEQCTEQIKKDLEKAIASDNEEAARIAEAQVEASKPHPRDVAFVGSDGRFVEKFPLAKVDREHAYRIYESIWRNMDRENNLINQRITWAILLTAGFLTAETFVLTRVLEVLTKTPCVSDFAFMMTSIPFFLCGILSTLAALFCELTRKGVAAAHQQTDYLKKRYNRLKVGQKRLFQDIMFLPRPFGNTDDHLSGNITARIFPWVMKWTWIFFALLEVTGGALVLYVHRDCDEPTDARFQLIAQRGS